MPLPAYSAQLSNGSINLRFHGWTGWAPGLQDQGEDYQRLGGTGSGAQITGTRGKKKECRAWAAFSTQSEMLSFVDNVEATEWQTMTLSSPWGRTAQVRVTKAEAEPKKCRGIVNFRVECIFEVERLT